MEIEIKNLRYHKPEYPWDIKVDRSSVLGNPFYMKTELNRNQVCDDYKVYFKSKIESNDIKFKNELNRLLNLGEIYGKLNLFCWCAPKRCHAETIRDYILNLSLENSKNSIDK